MIINQWSANSSYLSFKIFRRFPDRVKWSQLLFHSQLALKDGNNASSIPIIKKTSEKSEEFAKVNFKLFI